MSLVVDLTNLRSMTDGDREVEAMLFTEFNRAFVEGIAQLSTQLASGHEEQWRTQAHALKGIALNLGAGELSTLCRQAQETFLSNADQKQSLLDQITVAYERVRQLLEQETAVATN